MIPRVKYYGPAIPSTYAVTMTAAASGSNGITVADDDDIDFGTGDFFVSITLSRVTGWQPAALTRLVFKSDGANGYSLNIAGSGAGNFLSFGINGTTYTSSIAPFTVVQANQMVTFAASVVRSSASAAGSVTFYKDGEPFGTAQTISAGVPVTVNNAVPLYLLGTSTTRTSGTITTYISGNFAPTAAEVLDLCTNGIPESWKWGSQNAVSGDVLNGTGTRSFNAFTSGPDSFYGTAPEGNGTGRQASFAVSVETGDRYRLRATYSKNRTGTPLVAAIFTARNVLTYASNNESFAAISGDIDVVLTATSSGDYFIGMHQSGSGSPGAMELTVTSMTVQKLGATFAALPETIPTSGATAWDDSSGNTGGGTLPAAGATKVTIRK